MEYKVRLIGSDGKEYTITYEGLKEVLGIERLNGSIDFLYKKREQIEDVLLNNLLIPRMEKAIVNLVQDNPEIKTREINGKCPTNYLEGYAWYKAFEKLENEKQILATSHGSGHDRTWRVNEKEVES